ncbi:MAG: chemotaxis protein CheW [Candidatus Obscuribacterales bacterium]|nr:chemotaxis protein CheW [Candidatus Obscuribacterales bacterium]
MKRVRHNKEINWDELKEALAKLSIVNSEELTAAQAQALLDERARKLAEPIKSSWEKVTDDVLEFKLAHETYAIEYKYVFEVSKNLDMKPLPGATKYFRGITNLRGEILSIVDLHYCFSASDAQLPREPIIIVLGTNSMEFGFAVDSVVRTKRLQSEQLFETAANQVNVNNDYVKAVTADGLILIDGERILADERFYLND